MSGRRPGLSGGVQIRFSGPLFSNNRLIIGEALAFRAQHSLCGPFRVLDAKLGAIVVSEIELGQITMQVRLAD